MKVIDTNLLVRLITNDDTKQRDEAAEAIQVCANSEVLVSDIVLTELFFVLESRAQPYHLPRQVLCDALNELLETPQLSISPEARVALLLARSNPKLDFTDCLLATYIEHRKGQLLTFDKDLLKTLD